MGDLHRRIEVASGLVARSMGARLEIVARAHQALNEGDVDALVAMCAPDFRLDMSDRVLNPAIYEGHEGIRRFYSEVTEVWESFTWEPVELDEVGKVILVKIHSIGRGSHSGVELDRHSAMLWRFEGDQLGSLTFFRDPDEAERAARGQGGTRASRQAARRSLPRTSRSRCGRARR